MAPTIRYHCGCNSNNHRDRSGHPQALDPVLPPLPSTDPSALYAFHDLTALYFCEDCDAVRCSRCVVHEVTCYFCPNCQFEVPAASVRTERNRCARNCFLCPSCTNVLQVIATDPQQMHDPVSVQASIGDPPYYLSCNVCRWDSKEIGLTFEKSTGLSLQMQRREESAPDLVEFNHLKDHFEPFLRKQVALNASSGTSGTMPASSGYRTQSGQETAVSLKTSKLLRDVPSLASSGSSYLGGSTALHSARHRLPTDSEELTPYEALTSWESGRATPDGMGVMGQREERRRDILHSTSDVTRLATAEQKWTSLWDQPVRTSDLRPVRVPLSTRQTKRCQTCRHILIRPDSNQKGTTGASSSKAYRIKSVAMQFVPDVIVELAAVQPTDEDDAYRTSRRSVGPSSALLGGPKRRPSSIIGTAASPASGIGSASNFLDAGSGPINTEALAPGRTYAFELTFSNPLDDPMTVRVAVAKPTFRSPPGPILSSSSPTTSAAQTAPTAKSSKSPWKVVTSASSFTLAPYNEMIELDEEDADLLGSGDKASSHPGGNENEMDDVEDDDLEALSEDGSEDQDYKRSRTNARGASRRKRKGDGILRKKGHRTTIGLELTLAREAVGVIEFGLHLSFTYHPDPDEHTTSKSRPAPPISELDTTNAIWTSVRLGRVADVSTGANAGWSSAQELQKKRSSMLLGAASGVRTASSGLPSGASSGIGAPGTPRPTLKTSQSTLAAMRALDARSPTASPTAAGTANAGQPSGDSQAEMQVPHDRGNLADAERY